MRYCIIVNEKIKEEYSTLEEATPRLKLKNSLIVKIPEIAMFLKLYNSEGKFIGEIIGESNSLWFTQKSENQDILDPWLKDRMEQKYIDGLFTVLE